jgi:hypothetical protein
MIERDYIMRILKQFFDVLQKLINNIDPDNEEGFKVELNELCELYLGNSISFYADNKNEDILSALGDRSHSEMQARATMLAEVLYHNIVITKDEDGKILLARKVLALLSFIEEHSDTYSFERLSRIAEMRQMVG